SRRFVSWQRTQILKGSTFPSAEHNCRGGALADHLLRLRTEFRNSDIMNGAITIDDRNLYHRILGNAQIWIHLPFGGTGFADINQLSLGNVSTQGEAYIRPGLYILAGSLCDKR